MCDLKSANESIFAELAGNSGIKWEAIICTKSDLSNHFGFANPYVIQRVQPISDTLYRIS